MGRDPALSDRHPSVVINGNRYFYRKHPDPQYDYYLVEHELNGKDYWWFEEKQDLEAFLINLPESADRNLRLKLHPDWREVTPEQRDAYFEQDKLLFRAWAAVKTASGMATAYIMDLEGEHGPYEPQRMPAAASTESPIERVERQIVEYKLNSAMRAGHIVLPPGVALADLVYEARELVFESGLSEAGKLRWLEGEMDWTGVSDEDRTAVLAREVDFSRITPEQFAFVYEDIEHEKFDPVDARVATQLFQQALAAELEADAHAARVRDYGEADAATYNQRMQQGAAMPVTAVPRETWPSEIAKGHRSPPLELGEGKTGDQGYGEERETRYAPPNEAAAAFKHRVEQLWTTCFTDHETFWGDWSDLTAEGKLCLIAEAMDWDQVPESYFRTMVERELKIADLRSELQAAVRSPRENRHLFCSGLEQAEESPPATGGIHDTTRNLLDSILLDVWPRAGAILDFGLKSQAHYEAIYHGVRTGEISDQALNAAIADGRMLTALVRSAASNPHRDIVFHTDWDTWRGTPEPSVEDVQQSALPSPGDIAGQSASAESGLYQVWHDAGYPNSRIGQLMGGPAPVFPDDYVHVANVRAGSLEEAHSLTAHSGSLLDGTNKNWVTNPEAEALVFAPRSTDAGDVIVDPKGNAYRCERAGFQLIEPVACRRPSPAEISCDACPDGQSLQQEQEIDRER